MIDKIKKKNVPSVKIDGQYFKVVTFLVVLTRNPK